MDRRLFNELMHMIEPLKRKIMLVASKAVLELVKDATGIQTTQVSLLDDEVSDDVEHMQPGGLTHVPLPGAEGVYLTIGGVRDDGVVLALSNRANRPKSLQPGETCLYNSGPLPAKVLLKLDGSIEITAGTGKSVTINGVVISSAGAVSAPGDVSAMASSPSTARHLSSHVHPTALGPSGPPTPGT